MQVTRIEATSDGSTNFADGQLMLEEAGPDGVFSRAVETKEAVFHEVRAGEDQAISAASFVIVLDGQIEVEVGSGARRHFGSGSTLFVGEGAEPEMHLEEGGAARLLVLHVDAAKAVEAIDDADRVQESSRESFPASDPPSFTDTSTS